MNLPDQILPFLKVLQKNNNRIWFSENKEKYENANSGFKEFCNDYVGQGLRKTDMIEEIKTFRIHRDIRFSKDKTPYKTNFGAGFSRATARLRGGYYLHIEPGGSFAGGGFWEPNPADLKRIRDEFNSDAKTIMKIQKNKQFAAFFGQISGEELKTAPRGYDANAEAIHLIRKKQFVVMRKFTDLELKSPKFHEEVVKTFVAMRPFLDYMSDVLSTDINGEYII